MTVTHANEGGYRCGYVDDGGCKVTTDVLGLLPEMNSTITPCKRLLNEDQIQYKFQPSLEFFLSSHPATHSKVALRPPTTMGSPSLSHHASTSSAYNFSHHRPVGVWDSRE